MVMEEGVEAELPDKRKTLGLDKFRKQNAHLGYPTEEEPPRSGLVQFVQGIFRDH